MTPKSLPARSRRATAGFTMVELLTVIAIIAILAAIVFPVMGTVRESARRGSTMSNLQKIAQGVAAYELDNREYPEFLFGPAICRTNGLPDPTCTDFYTMKETAALVSGRYRSIDPEYIASRNARKIFTKSLYPEYIRDVESFGCPNNNVPVPDNTVGGATRYTFLSTAGGVVRYRPKSDAPAITAAGPVTIPVYAYDAFDASPAITDLSTGKLQNNGLVARYSRLWTGVVDNTTLDAMSPANAQVYQRQLLWARPPAETVVTMTTHHAPKGKVLVLFLNGTAKVLDNRKLAVPSIGTNAFGDYQFWKLSPN